jgi:hypothetical protein
LSPILVRPVREQLEHDRLIRLLQTKFRRKYEVGINPGAEQNSPVGTGPTALFPDLVLMSPDRGHRVQAVVEVETGESVNHLEALAEWAHFAKTRAAFHLYVPASMMDVARRLSEDNHIQVDEIWSYHIVGDEPRFTVVHRNREVAPPPRAKPAARPAPKSAARPVAKPAPATKKPAARPSKSAKASKPAKIEKSKKAAKGKKRR